MRRATDPVVVPRVRERTRQYHRVLCHDQDPTRPELSFPPSAGHMVMRLEVDGVCSVVPTRSATRCRSRSVGV